ncbi:hypothetical protein V6N12_065089 [Hibiscus sabdariffa]|uniref:Uncharacterized protein n=1 Tax=Hibiscus sabdariffa TaxID=183260 RepID=A0ABR2G7P3_9ROSI
MKVLWTAAGQYIIHPCCVDKRKVGVYDTTGQSTFEKSRNICLDKEQKIGSAVDVDEDEFVVVGEHTNASAEKEGVGPKSLDEDVVRVPEFIDKDVVIMKEDIILDRSGVIPSIRFSDRVHDQIDHNMHNALIVRLFERSIKYKTLVSHTHALCQPIGELQFFYLDNNYFLIRFSYERDCSWIH